jgi:hypothetical protein
MSKEEMSPSERLKNMNRVPNQSEPEPTEFTEEVREVFKDKPPGAVMGYLFQACDEIDRLTAELQKFKAVCCKCYDAMKGSNCQEEEWLKEVLGDEQALKGESNGHKNR